LAKIRGLSGQVEQMKQLIAQLKKDKDVAAQKVGGLEKRIIDAMTSVQVRDVGNASARLKMYTSWWHIVLCCVLSLLLRGSHSMQ